MNAAYFKDSCGVDWLCREEFAPVLRELTQKDLFGALPEQETTLIKSSSGRKTISAGGIEGVEEGFFLKHYYCRGFFNVIKHMLQRSNARKEWELGNYLAERKINVPEPLACGERWSMGRLRESFFISRSFSGAFSIEAMIRGSQRKFWLDMGIKQRFELAGGVARVLARMHSFGFLHLDLHPGNILLRPGKKGFEICVTDLHRAKIDRHISLAQRLDNLAMFDMFFYYSTSRTLRWRFLKEYARTARELDGLEINTKQAQNHIFAKMRFLCRELFAKRDKKVKRGNGPLYESFLHDGRFVVSMSRKYKREGICELIDGLDGLFAGKDSVPGVKVLKDSRSTTLLLLEGGSSFGLGPVCVKRFNVKSYSYFLKYLFRPSKARRAWVRANGAVVRNFTTPEPIAVLERCRGIVNFETYYVCAYTPGAGNLSIFLEQNWEKMDIDLRRNFVLALSRFVRGMYEHGLFHRDLKASNILVVERPGAERGWDFSLLDTSDLSFVKNVKPWQRELNRRQLVKTLHRYFTQESGFFSVMRI